MSFDAVVSFCNANSCYSMAYIKWQDNSCQFFFSCLALMQMYWGWSGGAFETLKLDCRAPGHSYSPLCQVFETEPWDRRALMAKQLMSTLDLWESFWIMCHWVPGPLLHKNRWSQGHPSLLSHSHLLCLAYLMPLSLHRSLSTHEKGYLSNWWWLALDLAHYLCDRASPWMQNPLQLRAQLFGQDWNWMRRTGMRSRGRGELRSGQKTRNWGNWKVLASSAFTQFEFWVWLQFWPCYSRCRTS